jgi:hypothetical protein
MLRSWQAHFTLDGSRGTAYAYVLAEEDNGQLRWLGDTDFGPFDTWQDVCAWYTRTMVKDGALLAH